MPLVWRIYMSIGLRWAVTSSFFHYQAPSWAPWGPPAGPSQNQPGFRDAENLYPNHVPHGSTETISMDGYTGPHPGHTCIGAIKETGGREV